jgi:hypothetical protein
MHGHKGADADQDFTEIFFFGAMATQRHLLPLM